MAKTKVVREVAETGAEFAKKAYDEILDFFGYGADAEEIMSQADKLSPQTRNVLKALERDDFLGFETPDQALKQYIEDPVYTIMNYDLSPQLKGSLTKFANNPPSKPKKTMADVNPRIGGTEKLSTGAEYDLSNAQKTQVATTGGSYEKARGILDRFGVMGKKQIAEKAAGLLDDLWWHGSDAPFRTFDDARLGTGEGGRDSAFGFFFGKNPKTAQSYLPEDMAINPELFNQTFGMPISEAEVMRSGLLDEYAKSKGISVEDAIGYSHPDAIIKQKYKLKPDELASKISALDKKLNPYHYETGAYGKSSKDWLNKSRQGYLMGANIPDMQDMKVVDMSGEAWDEGKQALIAKMARDEGYSGVVFKNMVDDAFSGSGADDIALVFDTRDITTRQVKPVNMPDVNFNDLKSIGGSVGLGILGQMLADEQDKGMY